MKFLVDAQLTRRLVQLLENAGHDAINTADLPHGNRTSEQVINDISEREQRIVITKDTDFVNSFLVLRRPYKLLLISTGNTSNAELESLFRANLPTIGVELLVHDYVELSRTALIMHL